MNQRKWTNEYVDRRLKDDNRPIERVGNIANCNFPVYWKCCANLGHSNWKNRPIHIINEGRGCPECAIDKRRLTIIVVNKKYNDAGFELLGEYKNNSTPTLTKHKACGFEWKIRPADIFRRKSGCPLCAGNLPLTKEIVIERYYNLGYELLGEYKNVHTPILTRHKECRFEWNIRPSDIFRNHGCPHCAAGKNEKLVGKILKEFDFIFDFHKNIKLQRQDKRCGIFVDYWMPELNIIIEYNGAQHYHPVSFFGSSKQRAEQQFIKQQARDLRLSEYCIVNNIIFIQIDGRKYFNLELERYMKEIIIPRLQEIKLRKTGT
jgi:hypothetical protein